MTDEDQAVMFGGYTPSRRSSEAHVLHLPTMVSHICLSHMYSSYIEVKGSDKGDLFGTVQQIEDLYPCLA